jgi:hypothetical protein
MRPRTGGAGVRALWLPGGQIDNLGRLADAIRATTPVPVGSAIISADVYTPDAVSRFCAQLEETAPGRLVAGLGGPQQPRPLAALNRYLDQLDHAEPPLPAQRRLLASLGPRKLQLAGLRLQPLCVAGCAACGRTAEFHISAPSSPVLANSLIQREPVLVRLGRCAGP